MNAVVEIATPWGFIEEEVASLPESAWGKHSFSGPDVKIESNYARTRQQEAIMSFGHDMWYLGPVLLYRAKRDDIKHFHRISNFLVDAQIKYRYSDEILNKTLYPRLIVEGIDVTSWLEMRPQFERGGYRKNGKYTYIVSPRYKNTTKFPQKKNGTFAYEKIAEVIRIGVKERKMEIERNKTEKSNSVLSAELRAKFYLSEYSYAVRPSANTLLPINLNVEIRKNVTVEEATKILQFLQDNGLLK